MNCNFQSTAPTLTICSFEYTANSLWKKTPPLSFQDTTKQFWTHTEGLDTLSTTKQFWTHTKGLAVLNTHWGFFFRVYKGTESPVGTAIFLALNRQWQLQLAMKSPMAVATCLLACKRCNQLQKPAPWNSPVWLAVPSSSYIANGKGDLFLCMCKSLLSVATPGSSSKPASPTGGLLAPCMQSRPKVPPWVNTFKTTPFGEKVFKTTPNGEICLTFSVEV